MIHKKLFLAFITILEVSVISIYYTIAAILLVATFQNIVRPLSDGRLRNVPLKDETTVHLIIQACLEASIIGIFAYFIKKIVEMMPTPMKALKGYNNVAAEQVSGGFLIGFLVIKGGLVDDFKSRLGETVRRVNKLFYYK